MVSRTPHPMGCLGSGLGICSQAENPERAGKGIGMDAIENIALFCALMVLGASLTMSVLLCFVYFIEAMDD